MSEAYWGPVGFDGVNHYAVEIVENGEALDRSRRLKSVDGCFYDADPEDPAHNDGQHNEVVLELGGE